MIRLPAGSLVAPLKAALADISRDLLRNMPKFSTKTLTKLMAVAKKSSNDDCARPEIDFDAKGNFRNVGHTCRIEFSVPINSGAAKAQLTLPTVISGVLALPSSYSRRVTFTDASESPMLDWYDVSGKFLGDEPIASVEITPNIIKVIGARHYCVHVVLGG